MKGLIALFILILILSVPVSSADSICVAHLITQEVIEGYKTSGFTVVQTCKDVKVSMLGTTYFHYWIDGCSLYTKTPSETTITEIPECIAIEDFKQIADGKASLKISPNPLKSAAQICFNLPAPAHVKLEVFNILGERVGILMNRYKSSGNNQINWNAVKYSPGMYYLRLTLGDFTIIRRCITTR